MELQEEVAVVENQPTQEGSTQETQEQPSQQPQTEPKKPWHERRIGKLTAEKYALQAELEKLRSQISQPKEENAVDVNKLVEEKLAQREFDKKCNDIFQAGLKNHEGFQESLEKLRDLEVMTPQFINLITDLDKADEVLYYLGNNPEEADRIRDASPAKQAMELAKLDARLSQPKKDTVSKAPAPVETVKTATVKGSNSWATKYYDGMPQEEFNAWVDNNKQKK